MNDPQARQFEALAQLDHAYDDAPVGFIALDPAGVITRANRAFLELTGHAEDEVVGRLRLGDLLTLAGRMWAETHFHPALLMHGHVYEAALDLVRKDGGTVPTLVNAIQRRDAEGRVLFSRVTLFRATERRRYEQELLLARREAEQAAEKLARATAELERSNQALQQANRELAQFAHMASHDLQAPLRVVTSFVELLEMRLGGTLDERNAGYFRRVVETTKRMQALVGDLLDLARAGPPVREEVDLGAVVADVRRLLDADIVSTGAEVVADALPTVHADPRQLTQLLQNLVGNALRYRHPSRAPLVRISAQPDGDGWVVSVRDNGQGFDMRHAERIFAPFERLQGEDAAGTGLGLSLCRKAVEAHGGRIWAESVPGEGSCFFFSLPGKA